MYSITAPPRNLRLPVCPVPVIAPPESPRIAPPDGIGRNFWAAIARLRSLGHRVGLHAVHPDATLDSRFDPVVAWHTPDPSFMTEPLDGAVNVMQSGFFDPGHYRSDSNQHWRHGCPHEELARGEFDWLQLLVHPEIWVYPGDTMRETMLAMLEAERERRVEQLGQNRIDLS